MTSQDPRPPAFPRLPDSVASYLHVQRALPDWAIRHFGLTWDARLRAIAIPFEGCTKYRSFTFYDPNTGRSEHGARGKMFWAKRPEHLESEPLPPYPSWNDWRDPDCEVIVEGEFDAMVAMANGILAVSGSAGSATFTDEWASALTGQQRVLLYDNDDAGRAGALKAAARLVWAGCRPFIAAWPAGRPNGWDATDHFRSGGSADELRAVISHAVEYMPPVVLSGRTLVVQL